MLSRVWIWIRRDTTSTDWLIVLLTAVIAGTSYLQWHEIKSGGQDTHDLAVHAKEQADKMKDMSEAAEKIRLAAEGMVTQEQRIADNAKLASEASNRQSKTALDASIAASRNDQRAWLGIHAMGVVLPIETNHPLKINFATVNSGKTAASDTTGHIYVTWSDHPITTKLTENLTQSTPTTKRTLFPGVPYTSEFIALRADEMTEDRVKAFKDGNIWLYAYGNVSYTDVFNRPHETSYCAVSAKGAQAFEACPEGIYPDYAH